MRESVQTYYGQTLQSSADLATNACCDLDHTVGDEPELFVFRSNTAAHRYGQRPERCDDEWCFGNLGYV